MYNFLLVIANIFTYFGFCFYYLYADLNLSSEIFLYKTPEKYNTNKLQNYNEKIWDTWATGFKKSAINSIFTLIVIYNFTPPAELISYRDLFKIPCFVLLADLWFYSLHRLFHSVPILYKIHKHHHVTHLVTAASGLDAHFIEHIFITLGTILVPQYILQLSKIALLLICVYSNYSVTSSHTANKNDILHTNHHKFLKVNYGTAFYLFDRIFKTYKS